MSNFLASFGQLLLAEEVVSAAPALETYFAGMKTAGTDPIKNLLLFEQLKGNLAAAQIGALAAGTGALDTIAMTYLTNLVTKEQAVLAGATPTPAPAVPS